LAPKPTLILCPANEEPRISEAESLVHILESVENVLLGEGRPSHDRPHGPILNRR
jgi:hypothetical protein